MTRVRVVGSGQGGRDFTAWLLLDDGGVCVEAPPPLEACLGHARGALRTYFARQGWTATILVPKATTAADPRPALPGLPADIADHPLVSAILAAWPGATVRPIDQPPPTDMMPDPDQPSEEFEP